MVNNDHRLLVSGACQTVIRKTSGRTIISNGPVYELAKAQILLTIHGLRVINESAALDQSNEFTPELDDDELIKFICELKGTDFQNSERCKTSVGMTIDSDAYAMKWNRHTQKRWEHGNKIYVKFGFYGNQLRCIVVSIHPAEY